MTTPNYADTIRSHGWDVYDISRFTERPIPPSWDQLQAQGSAAAAIDGGTYILAPQHSDDMTLQEAYQLTEGVGPHLRISDPDSPDYAGWRRTTSPLFVFFSRIQVGFKVPPGPGQGDPTARYLRMYSESRRIPSHLMDMVLIDIKIAPEVFARDFGVMTPEEYHAEYNRWH